jgi:hypothetical protein
VFDVKSPRTIIGAAEERKFVLLQYLSTIQKPAVLRAFYRIDSLHPSEIKALGKAGPSLVYVPLFGIKEAFGTLTKLKLEFYK